MKNTSVVILFSLIIYIKDSKAQCPPPDLQRHSLLTIVPSDGFTVDENVTVECQSGFVLRTDCRPLECLILGDNGEHYRGTQNMTSGGRQCIKWNTPGNSFARPPDGPDHNYCRHATLDPQPNTWCYTGMTDQPDLLRWGRCNIPLCDAVILKTMNNCTMGYHRPISREISIICKRNKSWSRAFPKCIDINECELNPCSNDATCLNVPGSYTCSCSAGYQKDSTGTCIDGQDIT